MEYDDLIRRFSHSTEQRQKAIFSTLFIVGNRLQTIFDSRIPEVSLKQFMLLSIVEKRLRHPAAEPPGREGVLRQPGPQGGAVFSAGVRAVPG